MRERVVAWLMVVILVLTMPAPAFAYTATASDAEEWIGADGELVASSSDAYYEEQVRKLMSYAVMPLGGTSDTGDYPYYGLYNMDNTVSSDGCQVLVDYYDANGTSHISKAIPVTLGKWSSGNRVLCFDIRASMKPDDYVKTKRLLFQWGSGSLPSTGKYKMNLGFQVTEVPSPCTSVQFYTRKYIGNAKFQDAVENLEFTIQDNGKGAVYTMTSTKVVDFGNISYAEFRLSPDSTWDEMWSVVSGRVSIVLEKVDSSITTDITTAGGSYSSADAAADTAQNTSQIVQNTSEMNDTLKEIVQTISNQLAALWDQMYNLMHLPQLANDDKNTDRIIDKLGEDLNVEIQNQDDNTETIINGYDNSEMSSASDNLDKSLDEYGSAQKAVTDEASGYINDFQIADFDSYAKNGNVLNALSAISHIMQKIYDQMGSFTAAIDVSLTFVFVLMLIGYHRFRAR